MSDRQAVVRVTRPLPGSSQAWVGPARVPGPLSSLVLFLGVPRLGSAPSHGYFGFSYSSFSSGPGAWPQWSPRERLPACLEG